MLAGLCRLTFGLSCTQRKLAPLSHPLYNGGTLSSYSADGHNQCLILIIGSAPEFYARTFFCFRIHSLTSSEAQRIILWYQFNETVSFLTVNFGSWYCVSNLFQLIRYASFALKIKKFMAFVYFFQFLKTRNLLGFKNLLSIAALYRYLIYLHVKVLLQSIFIFFIFLFFGLNFLLF